VRVLVFKAGGVDDPEIEPEQRRMAFPPVAGYAGPVDLPTFGRPTMAMVGTGMARR
jgi:hypothetical protein